MSYSSNLGLRNMPSFGVMLFWIVMKHSLRLYRSVDFLTFFVPDFTILISSFIHYMFL